MASDQDSPISQLLQTLGMTREDLSKRSDQMRQFLTADSLSSRVFELASTASNTTNSTNDTRSRSSLSRARSGSLLDASSAVSTPPRTPIKREPSEFALPSSSSSRPLDTMEAVIERQRQARKEKRAHKKEKQQRELAAAAVESSVGPHPPSPTPSSASRSQAKKARLGSTPPPLTPQQSKYYREHTAVMAPTASQPSLTPSSSSSHYLPISLKQTKSEGSITFPPVTPRNSHRQRVFSPPRGRPSPLPSSPMSSPTRDIVNLVSSPGPLGPAPEEDEYDSLPYRLPPGPYSPAKPDCSYAALLGQAILSSQEHRLTLQEIYDWITIVYPYFKRGETTWMNSIRHVLSTTVCFRKVVRDRSQGRTLWAIWDEDLECFKDGGFRKQFCKDMCNKGKEGAGIKRTRVAIVSVDSGDSGGSRKAKRARKDSTQQLPQPKQHSRNSSSSIPHPAFPSAIPTSAHHQSYYQACATQRVVQGPSMPSFLAHPVPASSSVRDEVASSTSGGLSYPSEVEEPHTQMSASSSPDLKAPAPPSSSASVISLSSVPGLTPNRSSSSPPPSLASGDVFEDVSQADSLRGTLPVWDDELSQKKKTKRRKLPFGFDDDDEDLRGLDVDEILHEPPSPSVSALERKSAKGSPTNRLGTPPILPSFGDKPPPCTPPRKRSTGLDLSPERTPLSHRGLHMSPSASLAHYKNHLDPPPRLLGRNLFGDDDNHGTTVGEPSTPSRKRSHTSAFGFPATPKRVFGTPGSGGSSGSSMMSPFRMGGLMSLYGSTGGSGYYADPHDPLTLLNDDLNGIGASPSTGGLFGKKSRMILYDSPGPAGSSSKW